MPTKTLASGIGRVDGFGRHGYDTRGLQVEEDLGKLYRVPDVNITGPTVLDDALSPGGEGIDKASSPSERERVRVRVAHVFTHDPGQGCRSS